MTASWGIKETSPRQVNLRPRGTVRQDSLPPAGKERRELVGRQPDVVREPPTRFGQRMIRPITGEAQHGEHEELEVWNGHTSIVSRLRTSPCLRRIQPGVPI